jgi:hypothetical protein
VSVKTRGVVCNVVSVRAYWLIPNCKKVKDESVKGKGALLQKKKVVHGEGAISVKDKGGERRIRRKTEGKHTPI